MSSRFINGTLLDVLPRELMELLTKVITYSMLRVVHTELLDTTQKIAKTLNSTNLDLANYQYKYLLENTTCTINSHEIGWMDHIYRPRSHHVIVRDDLDISVYYSDPCRSIIMSMINDYDNIINHKKYMRTYHHRFQRARYDTCPKSQIKWRIFNEVSTESYYNL